MNGKEPETQDAGLQQFDWASKVFYRTVDPLSASSRGVDYTGLGCFPIGLHASQSDFDNIVRLQGRLLKLNMLKKVPKHELTSIGRQLYDFYSSIESVNESSYRYSLINQLAHALIKDDTGDGDASLETTQDLANESIEVYIGLDTGFRNPSCSFQFWGVFDGDEDLTRLYISRNAKDLGGTILHTYLSSKSCDRSSCFDAEYAFSAFLGTINNISPLPLRMLQDISMLTPTETLNFLQSATVSGSSNDLLLKICARCEYELIDVVSLSQLKKSNTVSYLRGDVTPEELVGERFQWYRQNKIYQLPRLDSSIELFKRVDQVVTDLLKNARKDKAARLLSALEEVLIPGKIDARADILALSVFCAFRRYALEEIYLEATDRCPVFGDQPDQVIVFAELWALGSHTESYLDITPKALGRILFDRYRDYYDNHQPPLEADDPLNFATAYPPAKTDIDREGITSLDKGFSNKVRGTAYLGVFAVPALIDILLLTTIGRGLYLSAYMTEIEQQMSTDALVIALILCGAVSSWIGAGGSYYLWAKVYPTMNLFMLTRFVGGVVFASIALVVSLVIVTVAKGIYGAFIFAVYLIILSTYLFLLGLMAILQFKGTPLPSVSSRDWFRS